MKLSEFAKKTDLLLKAEVDKVAYCAYYFVRKSSIDYFSMGDIIKWFEELKYSRPNISRLRSRLSGSTKFRKGTQKGTHYLHAKELARLDNELEEIFKSPRKVIKLGKGNGIYVDPGRINELKALKSEEFDLSKLIVLCDELNTAFQSENKYSIAMLTRAILDHVPPIFGCKTFHEVTNNYAGARSFKKSMQHLNDSCRNIADQHLHTQIRKNEVLPTITQVDFSNDLDVLLAEIIRLLKKRI